MTARSIRFGSCMAPNADGFIRDVLYDLEVCSRTSIQFVQELSWPEREAGLDRGEIELGWICGLPYVWKADLPHPPIRLLAAPVMDGARYDEKPVYFSDVVVRVESVFEEFSDLQGAVWGYNEPRSHSGYNVVRYELARRQLTGAFFGQVQEAGSHENALALILQGEIDAAAIDSTVLGTEIARQTGLLEQIRIIQTLGPSPSPPLVASTLLDPVLFETLQACLLAMHLGLAGRRLLAKHRVLRFERVDDSFYEPIREMARIAETVDLLHRR